MRAKHFLLAASTSLFLAACGDPAPPAQPGPATTAVAEPAPADAAPPEPPGDPLASISVSPNPVDLCALEKKITRVEVTWDVAQTNVRNFNVWVEAPTQPRKLWFSSFTPTGTKTTGNWVRNNTRFTIVSSDGRELTSVVVTAAACP